MINNYHKRNEKLSKKACKKFQNLSEEEKDRKRICSWLI